MGPGRGYSCHLGENLKHFNTYRQTLLLSDGTTAFVTIHPSWLLRFEDDADKQREYDNFVADLRAAASVLRKQVA